MNVAPSAPTDSSLVPGAKAPSPYAEQTIDAFDDLQNRIGALRDLFITDLSKTKAEMTQKINELRADVKAQGEAVDGMRSDLTKVSRFTNALHIEKAKKWNMMQRRPVNNLQQVPGPYGTLPWNTVTRGLNGEEIVLAPLVSLDAVQALGANELEAYVQLYYPGREVPEDITERKRQLLLAIGRPSESYAMV